MRFKPGDPVVLTHRHPLSAESVILLEPGDRGRVVRVIESHCPVAIHGTLVIVPESKLDLIDPLATGYQESYDEDWWV